MPTTMPTKIRRQYRFNRSRMLSKGVADGRTKSARFLAAAREQLITHLGGGKITPTQSILIDRITWLMLHTAMFDRRMAESDRPMNDFDRRSYLAFSNSLVRATRELGLKSSAVAPPLDAVEYGRELDRQRSRREVA